MVVDSSTVMAAAAEHSLKHLNKFAILFLSGRHLYFSFIFHGVHSIIPNINTIRKINENLIHFANSVPF